jgi:hypothetical protein
MLQNLVLSSSSAVVFGLASASACGLFIGTSALPFMAGAIAGFVFGSVSHYQFSVIESATFAREMPELFRYQLKLAYPMKYSNVTFTNILDDTWIAKRCFSRHSRS